MSWLKRLRSCALLASVLAGAACMGHVEHGRTLYTNGHYVEAADVFERGEPSMTAADPKERAQYGAYRGLTLLVLGDLARAQHWLTYAYTVERLNPGAVSPRLRAQLDQGWYDLTKRLGPTFDHTTSPPGVASDSAITVQGRPGATPSSTGTNHDTRRSLVND